MRIRGDRVAIRELTEQVNTSLALPQERNKSYLIGEVLFVGDGTYRGNTCVMYVRPGEKVLFQMNAIQAANSVYYWRHSNNKPEPLFIVNIGDLIGRVNSTRVTTEEFEVLGDWVLVEPKVVRGEDELIVIPDTSKDPALNQELFKYYFHSQGKDSRWSLDAEKGDELVVERTMVNPLEIDGTRFGFIPTDRVYGVVKA